MTADRENVWRGRCRPGTVTLMWRRRAQGRRAATGRGRSPRAARGAACPSACPSAPRTRRTGMRALLGAISARTAGRRARPRARSRRGSAAEDEEAAVDEDVGRGDVARSSRTPVRVALDDVHVVFGRTRRNMRRLLLVMEARRSSRRAGRRSRRRRRSRGTSRRRR